MQFLHSLSSTLALLRSTLLALFRPRSELILENLALRQQLAVLLRKHPHPRLRPLDCCFWILLCRLWRDWRETLAIVSPATVVRWHRRGFRWYWRWKCGTPPPGRPSIPRDGREAVQALMCQTPRWGAPRIHGELLKLGFELSERTVSRLVRAFRKRHPTSSQTWKTFLANHHKAVVAMDFFVVPTVRFKLLYGFVMLSHDRRRILHVSSTEHPTSAWVCQQLREAFPAAHDFKFMLHDHDAIFDQVVDATLRTIGLTPRLTTPHVPQQNGVVERCIGTLRRDLLDHCIVFNEAHLRKLLRHYQRYYNEDRTHDALEKDTPCSRPVESRPSPNAQLTAASRLGGLHHRYFWREAA